MLQLQRRTTVKMRAQPIYFNFKLFSYSQKRKIKVKKINNIETRFKIKY